MFFYCKTIYFDVFYITKLYILMSFYCKTIYLGVFYPLPNYIFGCFLYCKTIYFDIFYPLQNNTFRCFLLQNYVFRYLFIQRTGEHISIFGKIYRNGAVLAFFAVKRCTLEKLSLAVRKTGVSRHNGAPIKGPLNTIVL